MFTLKTTAPCSVELSLHSTQRNGRSISSSLCVVHANSKNALFHFSIKGKKDTHRGRQTSKTKSSAKLKLIKDISPDAHFYDIYDVHFWILQCTFGHTVIILVAAVTLVDVEVSAIPMLTPRPFNEPDEFVHAPLLVEFEAEVDVEVVDDDLVAVPPPPPPTPPPPPPLPTTPATPLPKLFFEALRSANMISLIGQTKEQQPPPSPFVYINIVINF
uniref:Uncharacterized protein n=1 Tax=Glossina pallidipes TaxID=7398 RepID=A0A1A9ZA02_GLOPL